MATKKTTAKKTQTERTINVPTGVIDFQKRVLNGQRSAFETSFKFFSNLQENQEKVFHGALDRAKFLPTEATEIAEAWTETRRGVRESYRETVDQSFSLVERWIDGLAQPSA